ncbi:MULTISPECIES: DUF2933 domain-containing protein [Streptomyces]|uniref:DUF2933 domain-containing protein n=1 Tax=Streptomyces TaxID=1883 RepID=UPI00073DD04B|nr:MULTISPECIES: DUF2933 domain-containing protein [unclassified Streptomyces]OYP13124.1 DUF2933 domain-containing protein [Streptomyces sp. FBKL.4005]BCM64731.1 hypothetical protein EASAB2608_00065 [Streptomyces sp. EAS-AB2608]CUW32657.1 hypothetical protein TUE45_pSRTUE45c_0025 [Streptomyces reticuli]
MNSNKNYGLYAVALAIAFVGALALGLPVGTLAVLAVAAACPLMMFFMMRGMHGGHDGHPMDERAPLRDRDHHQHPRSGRA